MAELAKLRKKAPATSRIDNPAFAGPGAANAANAASFFSTADEDDEELGIHFEVPWDAVKGRLWKDKNRLANCLDEYRGVYREAQLGCERLGDEVAATKEVYFGIVRLCYETEAWHRCVAGGPLRSHSLPHTIPHSMPHSLTHFLSVSIHRPLHVSPSLPPLSLLCRQDAVQPHQEHRQVLEELPGQQEGRAGHLVGGSCVGGPGLAVPWPSQPVPFSALLSARPVLLCALSAEGRSE